MVGYDSYKEKICRILVRTRSTSANGECVLKKRAQVVFPDGEQRECLVPLAGLMNHTSPSAAAHVVRYGSLSPASGCLEMRTQRACLAGDQLFLSYGPLSNLKLLLFYGFVLPGSPETSQFSVDFEVRFESVDLFVGCMLDDFIKLQDLHRRRNLLWLLLLLVWAGFGCGMASDIRHSRRVDSNICDCIFAAGACGRIVSAACRTFEAIGRAPSIHFEHWEFTAKFRQVRFYYVSHRRRVIRQVIHVRIAAEVTALKSHC